MLDAAVEGMLDKLEQSRSRLDAPFRSMFHLLIGPEQGRGLDEGFGVAYLALPKNAEEKTDPFSCFVFQF